MNNKINKAISKIIDKDNFIDKLVKITEHKSSKLVEIIGVSGTGKSHLHSKLKDHFSVTNQLYFTYRPPLFELNHFPHLLQLMTGLKEEQCQKLFEKAQSYNFKNKYDFFFYLSEEIEKLIALEKRIILIDDCNFIDRYSLDFIQYFIQAFHNAPIAVVIFTCTELFAISDKFHLEFLSKDDIMNILESLPNKSTLDSEADAEILSNITAGNIYLVEHILNDIGDQAIDLKPYLDKTVNLEAVYLDKVKSLTPSQKNILFALFLLDNKADKKNLTAFLDKKESELLTKNLSKLIKEGFIEEDNDLLILKIKHYYGIFFLSLPYKERSKQYQKILDFMKDSIKPPLEYYASYLLKLSEFDEESQLPTLPLINDALHYFKSINDYDVVIKLYLNIIDSLEDEKDKTESLLNLGQVYKFQARHEDASNCFREALQLSSKHTLHFDEIIFELTESLYKINSFTYAIEILKKYLDSIKDTFWKCKLLLLKADILIDTNNDEEAISITDIVYEEYRNIKNEEKRLRIYAQIKKTIGKIYYYSNQWDKAETAFTEAGKTFKQLNDNAGQAAILNNLGVVKMYGGKWQETEELYNESLQLEKARYNLEGISVCYNNLGGLWADRGDFNKAISFFNEALRIKKLLNDRYNICNIYNNIGVTYMDNGEYEKASEAYEMTIETARNYGLYKNLVAALNNLGALYFKTGKWSEAAECYEDAITRSESNKFIDGLCKSYNNMGELYEKRGDYELARDYYFKALHIIPELNDEFQKAEIWGNMGNILTHLQQFSEAYGYLVESLQFFEGLNTSEKIIEGCHKMAFYFISTNNTDSANYYLDKAMSIAETINQIFEQGKTYFIKGIAEKKDHAKAKGFIEKAVSIFVETKNYYELALANYELAVISYNDKDWQKALDILKNNKKILEKYGAISLIEKNDIFIQKIEKEYSIEIKETRSQESLLTKFYETTQNLKSITNFKTLLEYTLNSFVDLSEADGGVITLYNTRSNSESWEYKIFNSFTAENQYYEAMMDIINKTYEENKSFNYKQPHFAPKFNNVISFPLSFHNQTLGVILLFIKQGSRYFPEKVHNLLNALSNQAVVIIENSRYIALSQSHATIREELNTPQQFTNIIGKSEKMQDIFKMIEKIKDTPTTILVEGQSGTGKELIARAIHYSSIRKNKQFVAQYCGSLPETLLESELFGHVKGSFTGATYDKKGLFEIADGGTFFLDEIADISLSTQAKLLRFLQEGEIKRVGSTKTQTVDVRVICATNVPLKDKIDKGEFRLDLYYRLNVIRIEVPPLTERKSDIPLLAIFFLDRYSKKMNKSIKGITDETMKYFQQYDWPGNIRQLENEIERAVTLAEEGSYIKPSDLSEELFHCNWASENYNISEGRTLKDVVEDIEKKMIVQSLENNSWNQTQTSKELGLSRQGLIKKIKRYELDK